MRSFVCNMAMCKTLNFTKCSRVFYIIIANYCIKSCVANPKQLLTLLLRDMVVNPMFPKRSILID